MEFLLALAVFCCGAALNFHFPEFPQLLPQSCSVLSAANTERFLFSDNARKSLEIYRSVTHLGATQIQHTLLHINCPACELDKAEPDSLAMLPFVEAANLWLFNHRQYIEPRTARDYEQHIRSLSGFFIGVRLGNVNIERIRIYQRSRQVRASAGLINREISTLRQILRDAELEDVMKKYKPLPMSKEGSGHAYTPEQKNALIATAWTRKRWILAGHCLRVMLNTGTGYGELSGVRRKDFDIENRFIWVLVGAKNQNRRRRVPLNDEAFESMCWLHKRWLENGGKSSDQFILYHRSAVKHGPPEFYRRMGSIKNAFTKIKVAAGLPEELRIYDCRVTAVTETLSSGKVSIHTAKKLFGHVSEEMQKRYYKPDMDTLREAVDMLGKKQPERAPNVEKEKVPFFVWNTRT